MRFTNSGGVIDRYALDEYLENKMTTDSGAVRRALNDGKTVNLTCAFSVMCDLAKGKTTFTLRDIELGANGYIVRSVLDDNKNTLTDGVIWGNITLEYVPAEGKKPGYVNMISFRPFRPIEIIDLDYYAKARAQFSFEEWLDVLISGIGYAPESFSKESEEEATCQKCEFLTRLLPIVEPGVNGLEFGPKGTGKSFTYKNSSKFMGTHDHGNTTIAELFYNRLTKLFGPIKTLDAYVIDEISSFSIQESVSSPLKVYLESGTVCFGNVSIQSECGMMWVCNIPLTADLKPVEKKYFRCLPKPFYNSAVLDRFHVVIEGWKIPRLTVESIYKGWGLNKEYLSEVFHSLRTRPEYGTIFDDIVSYEGSADLRDVKAVKKVATAYCKLFFPHVTDLSKLGPADLADFLDKYEKYCLRPAIEKRGIIRQQCHYIDIEYKEAMPGFNLLKENVETEGAEVTPNTCDAGMEAADVAEERIYIHSLFLSEGEFKAGEKEKRMALIEDAEHWIEEQASHYGKRITFVNGHTGLDEGWTVHAETPKDIDCPECHGADTNYYLSMANKQFNVDQLLYTSRQRDCSRAALLVIVDADGRSFAGWQGRGEEHMGCAVLYGDDNLQLHSGVVAHELLHLMGAVDLYADYQPAENVAFMEGHYPNEVMFDKDHAPADTLAISPFTAWMVGWNKVKEAWFDRINITSVQLNFLKTNS